MLYKCKRSYIFVMGIFNMALITQFSDSEKSDCRFADFKLLLKTRLSFLFNLNFKTSGVRSYKNVF